MEKSRFIILVMMSPVIRAMVTFDLVDDDFVDKLAEYMNIPDKTIISDWIDNNIVNKPPGEEEEDSSHYMNVAFSYISKNPEDEYLIKNDAYAIMLNDRSEKVKVIQKMIDFFIEIEEYEKCSTLQKILTDF